MNTTINERTVEVSEAFFASLPDEPAAIKAQTFRAVTGLEYQTFDAICIGQTNIPANLSAKQILSGVRMLLGLRSKEAAELLGVSESGISRGKQVDLHMLDRVEGMSDAFARVALVLGLDAQRWFRDPNPALQNAAPYTLMSTQYGQKKIDNLITSLLNGAVV